MKQSICWIDIRDKMRLAIMPRPRAGEWLEDEIAGWRAEGIDIVVSLLEPHEVTELDLQQEVALCHAYGIEFISFAIPDRGVPASLRAASDLALRLATCLADGDAVAIHCRIGIGRSAVIAACVLQCCGHDADQALQLIADARGTEVPDTAEQRA